MNYFRAKSQRCEWLDWKSSYGSWGAWFECKQTLQICKNQLKGEIKKVVQKVEPCTNKLDQISYFEIIQKYGDIDIDDIRMKLDAIK